MSYPEKKQKKNTAINNTFSHFSDNLHGKQRVKLTFNIVYYLILCLTLGLIQKGKFDRPDGSRKMNRWCK